MPSCVVKSCKNYASKVTKLQGISYHTFPRNKKRRDDWILIIRNCREDNNWNPSSASTVCSAHFDDVDYITTAKGLRCLVPYAIPKRLLSKSPEAQTRSNFSPILEISPIVREMANDQQPTTSSSSTVSSLLQVPVITDEFNLTGYCRLCANSIYDGTLVNVESDNVIKELVVKMSNRLNTNIDFSQEHLPTTACSVCLKSLYMSYDFVVGIDLAQMTLNKISMQNNNYQMQVNLNHDTNVNLANTSLQQANNSSKACDLDQHRLHVSRENTSSQQLPPENEAAPRPHLIELSSDIPLVLDTPIDLVQMTLNKISMQNNNNYQMQVNLNHDTNVNLANTSLQQANSSSKACDLDQHRLHVSKETTSSQQLPPENEAAPRPHLIELSSDIPLMLDTPRKLRLKDTLHKKKLIIDRQKKNIRRLNQKVRRFRNRNESLKNILKNLKERNFISPDLYNTLNENIVAANLFNNYNRKKLKKNIRYSHAIKKFCLTLNYYSPRAYDYIRQSFDTCLPHRKTLAKWYGHIKGEPGFTEESFQALKAKAEVSQQHRLLCSLVFDEVAIRTQKIWDGKKNIGFVDMGTGVEEGAALASQALVLFLVGINQHLKVPLGYFLSNGITGEQKSNLIKLCLIKCFESDVDVVSLTCDGHATNLTALELLGCNLKLDTLKTTFKHPSNDSEIACFLDPSHMIKLIRNHLQSKYRFVDCDDRVISWDIIQKLNKFQDEEGLHLANKLTKSHINFKNKVMKVKLATQIFSTSVADAINTCREILKIPEFEDSEATENFIKKINDMFDIFNSRAMRSSDYKQPLCAQNKNKIFDFLNDLKDYIMKIKIKTQTKRKVIRNGRATFLITRYLKPIVESKCKTGFIGTLININSLQYLYDKLIDNGKLVYLPTYKLSQDHLEIFFSSIRLQCGSNDNPNVRQFKGSYKKLLTYLEIKCISTGNCVPLEKVAILNCTSSAQIINSTIPYHRHDEEEDTSVSSLNFLDKCNSNLSDLTKQLEVEQLNDYRYIIIGYISGNIAYSLHKTLKCQVCLDQLITTDILDFHKLILKKNRGGLRFPSKDLFDICCVCEIVIRKLVKEKIQMYSNKQHMYLMTKILEMFIGNRTTFSNIEISHVIAGAEHKISLIKCIIEKYLNVRFHHISKIESVSRSIDNKRQVYKKLTQHKGF